MKNRSLPMIIFTILIVFVGCFLVFSIIYAPEIVLKADDAFKPHTIKSGSFFTIQLDTVPSSGYVWRFQNSNGEVVQYIREEYIPPSETDKEGTPGQHRFIFRAMGKGETVISVRYEKAYESEKPIQQREFNINVK
ncbi:MAG: protease inhibitor I42 family protein [Clostridia bacterium]|jgi:predicted secreted protein|nr:protease inhibitor I42 family protein [Clostridiaceae bacterium]